MNPNWVVQILQIGFPGVVAVLALLSARLVGNEQPRPDGHQGDASQKVRPSSRGLTQRVKLVRTFMWVTIVMCVLVVVESAVDAYVARSNVEEVARSQEARRCRDALERLENVGVQRSQTLESLKREVDGTLAGCKGTLTMMAGDGH